MIHIVSQDILDAVAEFLPRSHGRTKEWWLGELRQQGPVWEIVRAAVVVIRQREVQPLAHYVEMHLTDMGACGDVPLDSEESLCDSPGCTYCQLARAAQPDVCGPPLVKP